MTWYKCNAPGESHICFIGEAGRYSSPSYPTYDRVISLCGESYLIPKPHTVEKHHKEDYLVNCPDCVSLWPTTWQCIEARIEEDTC